MQILRRTHVIKKTGLSLATINRREKIGEFPTRIQLGENAVGWFEHEVDEYLKNLPRGGVEEPKSATTASLKLRRNNQ